MMIHIACNIDHNYVRHCAVTLVSLFENNPKETFTVHIIARELSETDRNILTALAGKYNNKACYYTPDAQMLEGFTIRLPTIVCRWLPITDVPVRPIAWRHRPRTVFGLWYCNIRRHHPTMAYAFRRSYGSSVVETLVQGTAALWNPAISGRGLVFQFRCSSYQPRILARTPYRPSLRRLLPHISGTYHIQRPRPVELCVASA